MIQKNKYDLILSQIETSEHWLHTSRGEENHFGRYVFNLLAYRSLAWLFTNDDEITGLRTLVEYAYLRNPKLMTEIVDTKEFAIAREYVVKECGENLVGYLGNQNHVNPFDNNPDFVEYRKRTYTYLNSKDYAAHDRVTALLETIAIFDTNLTNCAGKRIDPFEKGARVFGDFLVTFANAAIPVLKNEKNFVKSKKVA